MSPSPLPSVCIIGAGPTGITTAKRMKEFGIPFDCYEASDEVGGNWYYKNPNGMSACYQSLHIDTSKWRLAFEDFPVSADLPDFPHHSQIKDYLEAYAEAFDLTSRIEFENGPPDDALYVEMDVDQPPWSESLFDARLVVEQGELVRLPGDVVRRLDRDLEDVPDVGVVADRPGWRRGVAHGVHADARVGRGRGALLVLQAVARAHVDDGDLAGVVLGHGAIVPQAAASFRSSAPSATWSPGA